MCLNTYPYESGRVVMSDDLGITNYGYYKIIDEDSKWIIFKGHPDKSWEESHKGSEENFRI